MQQARLVPKKESREVQCTECGMTYWVPNDQRRLKSFEKCANDGCDANTFRAVKKPKISASVGSCSMFVEGLDMNCPLCKVLVKSGTYHSCERKA